MYICKETFIDSIGKQHQLGNKLSDHAYNSLDKFDRIYYKKIEEDTYIAPVPETYIPPIVSDGGTSYESLDEDEEGNVGNP